MPKKKDSKIPANIFDRNGVWYARISFRDRDGRKRYIKRSAHSKSEAKELAKQLRRSVEDQGSAFIESGKATLNSFLSRWLDIKHPSLSERTYRDYCEIVERYISGRKTTEAKPVDEASKKRPEPKPVTQIGRKPLRDITASDIELLYSRMQTDRSLSARVVRYVHSILRAALTDAVRKGLLSRNPTDGIKPPKNEHREMAALSPEEASRFLEAAAEDKLATLFKVALITGLRPSEYLALQWKDVDLDRGSLTVQRNLTWRRSGGGFYFTSPKTRGSRRAIPLPATIINDLAGHKRRQSEARLALGPNYQNHDLIFAAENGSALMIQNVYRRHFKPVLKKAKLPPTIRLYDLRHSCATLLLSQGVNPKIVAERLGHATTRLTLDTYSHVLPGMQSEATAQLENLLFRAPATSKRKRAR